jgi:hypothetical protein
MSLSLANDYAAILVNNVQPGADAQGVFQVTCPVGSFCQVATEQVSSYAGFSAGAWMELNGVQNANNGSQIARSVRTLANGEVGNFALVTVFGLYAVRLRLLVAPVSGVVQVTGSTFPTPILSAANPVATQTQQLVTQLLALNLYNADQTGTDYLAGATAATYP